MALSIRALSKQLKAGSTTPGNITHFSGNALDLTLVLPTGESFDGAEKVWLEIHASKTSDPDDVLTDLEVATPTGSEVLLALTSAHMNVAFDGPIGQFWIVVFVTWAGEAPERTEVIWTANLLLQRHNASMTSPAPPAPVLRLTQTSGDARYALLTSLATLAGRVTALESSPAAVSSVAGKTGAVTLVKADVGLGSVDNTADADKPVSTAQSTALALKADKASPVFTGTPTAPTAATATNNTQLATTAFVHALAAELVNAAPESLNQLNELAAALGNDPNFSTTILAAVAGKLAKSANLSDLTDAFAARTNLELGVDNDVEFNSLTLAGGLDIAGKFTDVEASLTTLDSAIDAVVAAMLTKALFTAKGMLLTASADSTPYALAAGTNGYILSSNNSATGGLEWVAAFNPASPGTIGNGTAGSATFTGLNINSSDTVSVIQTPTGSTVRVRISTRNVISANVDVLGLGCPKLGLGTDGVAPLVYIIPASGKVTFADASGNFRDVEARDLTLKPSASLTPGTNGHLVIEATSNTSLTLKLKGSDGTVRSAVLTLS